MDRKKAGQENVGMPLMNAIDIIMSDLSKREWSDLQLEPVHYYVERMSMSHLPSLLDSALSDDALSALKPIEVQIAALVMLRDHFRHNADIIRTSTSNSDWIDEVFNVAFESLSIPPERTEAFAANFDLEDISAQWAETIAEPLDVMPAKLFVTHTSIVTGFKEENS